MNGQEPFLRIPPFPGAKVRSLVRPRSTALQPASDEQIDELIAEVRRLRIGGDYWSEHGHGNEPAFSTAADARIFFRKQVLERFDYVDPFTGANVSIREAIRLCAFWRQLIDRNRAIGSAVGFAFWKRPTVAPLLWGGSEVRFAASLKDVDVTRPVAIWKARTPPGLLAELEELGAELVEVEDGFIRSAGLGADCVPPLSIVVDRLGVHFDASRPSELESLIESGPFDADLLERAARLRELIVASGIAKYGAGGAALERRSDRLHVLVPGQVEDDRAVLAGGGSIRNNIDLLRSVRTARPDAYIIYKPHPDVEAGHRAGMLADEDCLCVADEIVRDAPIGALIDLADEVHVMSSLAGFEALLRGKSVSTWGAPFYSGWGLTQDCGSAPARRTARRTLDELVAAVLLLYPRYLDPLTGLPCPPEVLVRRIAEGSGRLRDGIVVQLRRLQGRWKKRLSRVGLG